MTKLKKIIEQKDHEIQKLKKIIQDKGLEKNCDVGKVYSLFEHMQKGLTEFDENKV